MNALYGVPDGNRLRCVTLPARVVVPAGNRVYVTGIGTAIPPVGFMHYQILGSISAEFGA